MRRWMTIMMLTCAIALLVMYTFHDSGDDLDSLARNGTIQADAPVKASVEIEIEAPPEKVWSVLTDVNGWPQWQPDIKDAQIAGPLESGTTFTWKAGGTRIHSRLALVEPGTRLAWTGSAWMARAVHVWKLEPVRGNKTRVKVDESMSGFALTFFYSSKDLEESDRLWLNRLKAAAER
jgi:uncharacterized protein YndB with AHSA1/START domain